MQQKFIKNLAFLLVLNIGVKPLWILGIQVAVQNRVGPADFGMYFTLLNFGYLFFIILDPGLNNFTNREISRSAPFFGRSLINTTLLKGLLGVVFAAAVFASAHFIMNYPPPFIKLLKIVSLNIFLASVLMFLRANLAGLQLFKWDSIASVLDRGLMILFCVVLLFYKPLSSQFNIFWFAWAQTAAYILTCLYAVIILVGTRHNIRYSFDFSLLIKVLKKSYPFALLTLLMSFYTRIDSVMIERMHSSAEAESGIYAQGFKIYEAANMIAFLFATLLLPLFSKLTAQNKSVNDIVNWSVRLLIIPSVLTALFFLFYSQPVMNLLYVNEVERTSHVFPVLMFSFIAVAANYIYGTLLTAAGELRFLNTISFAGLAVNLLLNYILIPQYGAPGAAAATLVTQGSIAVLQTARSYQKFNLRFYLRDTAKTLLLLTVFAAGCILLTYWEYSLLIGALWFAAGTAGLFYFKLINFRHLFSLLRYQD